MKAHPAITRCITEHHPVPPMTLDSHMHALVARALSQLETAHTALPERKGAVQRIKRAGEATFKTAVSTHRVSDVRCRLQAFHFQKYMCKASMYCAQFNALSSLARAIQCGSKLKYHTVTLCRVVLRAVAGITLTKTSERISKKKKSPVEPKYSCPTSFQLRLWRIRVSHLKTLVLALAPNTFSRTQTSSGRE